MINNLPQLAPCGCHKTADGDKPTLERMTAPMDQCIACAQKHMDQAYSAYFEFNYRSANRRFIRSQLRAVVNHTYDRWPEVAKLARRLALFIQQGNDDDKAMQKLADVIDNVFATENQDVMERIQKLDALHNGDLMDVIIPLGPGSVDGKDDELKILLRSLQANCKGMGRVIIVTDCPPAWLDPDAVSILPMADKYDDNKDANLIDKTLAAIEKFDVRQFVWMADDNVVMHPMDLRKAPKVYNCRTRMAFTEQKIWHERMRNTFDTFPQLTCNYDSHTPQPFRDAKKLLQCMQGVNYRKHPGLCIMTAFYAAMGELESDTEQYFCKLTVEKEAASDIDLTAMMYLGYGDKGFPSIRAKLFDIFKEPSRFERKQ